MVPNTDVPPLRLMDSFRRLYGHFSVRRRYQLGMVLVLMLAGAFAELLTLAPC